MLRWQIPKNQKTWSVAQTMTCKVCNRPVLTRYIMRCACGYCYECIGKHGHDGCSEIIKKRRENEVSEERS